MVELVATLRLAGSALGVVGAALLFLEFFQMPSYLSYNTDTDAYSMEFSPSNPREYTWAGRIGALLVGLAFAAQFLATFLA